MRYMDLYQESIDHPEKFWMQQAAKIAWFNEPTQAVSQHDKRYDWFPDGTLNTCYLALDQHIEQGKGDQMALIYDSPVTDTIQRYTYLELLTKVSSLAHGLAEQGIGKGDTVVIYMPMIPEAVMAMLACARIGAVHSVVFGGFAPHELALRIDDAKPKAIISADYGIEINRKIEYLELLKHALQESKQKVDHVIIKYRGANSGFSGAHDLDSMIDRQQTSQCAVVNSNDPLYILYTSGTTGQPKGIVRENGGHAVAMKFSMDTIYNAKPGSVYWAASDIGWVVGHSYIVYAPLIQGCTTILYEGKPIRTPDAGAFWRVIEEHKVNVLFTAPTAIRAIKKEDSNAAHLAQYDISSLHTLFLAGERCDPPTLQWITDQLQRPVIDHWWQTETGWPIVANPMGVDPQPVKPGSSGLSVCGYNIKVIKEDGTEAAANEEGAIVIKLPMPPGCLQTLWQNEERYVRGYLSEYPGYYKSGDGGYIDDDGYIYIMGRMDDVINVAGHRLSTGEMEEIINSHDKVAECAVFKTTDDLKGEIPSGIVVLKDGVHIDEKQLEAELVHMIRETIGHIACMREVKIARALPKTRSGKTVRKLLSAIHDGKPYQIPSTIDNRNVLDDIHQLYNTTEQIITKNN